MSSSHKPLQDRQPAVSTAHSDAAPDEESVLAAKRPASGRFWNLRRSKPKLFLLLAGMGCASWLLVTTFTSQDHESDFGPGDSAEESSILQADLGTPSLGEADSDIAQIEFLDEERRQPDPDFLPFDYEASETKSVAPDELNSSPGDGESPAWLLGTIEDIPQHANDSVTR